MKKKILKFLSVSLVIVLGFVAFVSVSNAEGAPSSITIKRAEVLSDFVTNYDHGFTIFTTNEGQIIYCLDVDKKALKSGDTASISTQSDAGLLYIMTNGYPSKNITGNAAMDKYITQAAIWWYMDESGMGGKVSQEFKNENNKNDLYGLVPTYIKPMVEKALTAKNDGYSVSNSSIKVNVTGSELSITKDGNYYESPYISASLVGTGEYTVSVKGATANTSIIGEDGKVKNSFKSSERFKVRIPTSELNEEVTISISVSAVGKKQDVKIYNPASSSNQRVIGLFEVDENLEQVVTMKASPETTSIEVDVPNTSANIILSSVIAGVLILCAGVGMIIYRSNDSSKGKKTRKK